MARDTAKKDGGWETVEAMLNSLSRIESTDVDQLNKVDLDRITSAIRYCLKHEEAILNILMNIYKENLEEQTVQPILNRVFENHPILFGLCMVAPKFQIKEIAEEAVEHDLLKEREKEEFLTLWNQISWIMEPAIAFDHQRRGFKYWTRPPTLNYHFLPDGKHTIGFEYTAYHGFDEIWNLHIPLEVFVEHVSVLTRKINMTMKNAKVETAGPTVSESELKSLEQAVEQMSDSISEFQDTVDQLAAPSDEGGYPEMGDITELFDGTEGQKHEGLFEAEE